MDNLWGDDVYELVFKPVLKYLGEDVDKVYARLFKTDGSTRLIENIIRSDAETLTVEDEDGEVLNAQSYLKSVNGNTDEPVPLETPLVNEYEIQQNIGGNIFV